jgi:hypothetical protein
MHKKYCACITSAPSAIFGTLLPKPIRGGEKPREQKREGERGSEGGGWKSNGHYARLSERLNDQISRKKNRRKEESA